MGLIVCKFGGTSLAGAAQLRVVRRIVLQDPRRRLIVASAPGRRMPGDNKITDLLLRGETDLARRRLQQLADDVCAPLNVILPPDAAKEFLVSRGEFYCARILAHVLGFSFIDAAALIHFHENGHLDTAKTHEAIRAALDPMRPAVIPGFYGALPEGEIHTLPRGGSDTTGALIAAAMNADCYENFTDVPGLFDCDPALAPDARSVPFASYEEVRLLARFGANVLHEDAVAAVQRADVPIRLCSTFAPHLPGTRIAHQPSDRPLLALSPSGEGVRCAAAGRIPPAFPETLTAYSATDICISPHGITFALPLPLHRAVPLLRDALKS